MKNISSKFLTIKSFSLYLLILSFCLFAPISCGKDKTDDPSCTEQEWYKDADEDDQGNASISLMACEQPDGYVANDDDPDDSNPNITSDCDMITYYPDEDGDGYGKDGEDVITQCVGVAAPTDYVADNTDCDDANSDIYPDLKYYQDNDNDGFGNPEVFQMSCIQPDGYVLDNTDCNDDIGFFDASEWVGQYNVTGTKYINDGTTEPSDFSCSIELVEGEANTLKLVQFWNIGGIQGDLYLQVGPCTGMATWNQSTIINTVFLGDIRWNREDTDNGFSANNIVLDPLDEYGWCSLNFENKTIELFGSATLNINDGTFGHFKYFYERAPQ